MKIWLFAFVALSATGSNAQDAPFEGAPPDQKKFVEVIENARTSYSQASNELAKGSARPARARAICSAFKSRKISGWVGRVYDLSTNGDGLGVLSVEIGKDVYAATWNNALSDLSHKSMIDPDSKAYQQAMALKEGDTVKFSGSFYAAKPDCFAEQSMTLGGSIGEPEFVFKFSTVEPFRPSEIKSDEPKRSSCEKFIKAFDVYSREGPANKSSVDPEFSVMIGFVGGVFHQKTGLTWEKKNDQALGDFERKVFQACKASPTDIVPAIALREAKSL